MKKRRKKRIWEEIEDRERRKCNIDSEKREI
jgi:hypothetical protein